MLTTIKIPKGLPQKIAGNSKLMRAIKLFAWLKAYDAQGKGKFFVSDYCTAASLFFGVHRKTIIAWTKLLEQFELITPHKIDNKIHFIKPISWVQLSNRYNCSATRFYYINAKKLNIKLEYILSSYAINEYQNRCKEACQNKREYAPIKEGLKRVEKELSIPLTSSNIKKCQYFDFLTAQTQLTDDQRFFIMQVNPDYNVGYKKLTNFFNFSSNGSFAYKKRKLKECGLINVEQRQIAVKPEYAALMTTTESRATKLGNTPYFRPQKTIILQLCDNITFNPQKNWKQPPEN